MASINDMSQHILETILLNATEELSEWISVFPRVCRSWKNNIMPLLWSRVDMLKYCVKFDPEFRVYVDGTNLVSGVENKSASIVKGFKYIISRCPANTKIILSNCWEFKSFTAICTAFKSKELSKLTNLTLYFSEDMKETLVDKFSKTFQNLTNLQEIAISYANFSKDLDDDFEDFGEPDEYFDPTFEYLMDKILSSCKSIKSVSFCCDYLVDKKLFNVLEELPLLETFNFKIVGEIRVGSKYFCHLIDMLAKCSQSLQNISFLFGIESVVDIERCKVALLQLVKKDIRSLNLGVCVDVNYPGKKLVILEGFEKVFSPLIKFANLKVLNLYDIDLSNNWFPVLLQRLPLTNLKIDAYVNLDDEFFSAFDCGMKSLECFSIGDMKYGDKKPSAECLVEFLAKCPCLENFSFSEGLLENSVNLFFELFHAKFHCCTSCSNVLVKIAFQNGHTSSVVDEITKERLCGVKVFKKSCVAAVFHFFKSCQK